MSSIKPGLGARTAFAAAGFVISIGSLMVAFSPSGRFIAIAIWNGVEICGIEVAS